MGQYRLVTGSYWDRKHSYISRRIVKEYDFSRETKDYKTTKLTWGEQTKREELKSQIRLFRIVKDEDILQDIVIGRHYVEPDKPGSEDDDHDESEGIEQEQSEEDEEEEDAETETESEDDDEDDEGGDRAFHGSEGIEDSGYEVDTYSQVNRPRNKRTVSQPTQDRQTSAFSSSYAHVSMC